MISNLKTVGDKCVNSLSYKFKNAVGARQMNEYVNNRIMDNAVKLGDTYSHSKKAEFLSKVSKKATADWKNTHKIRTFIMNNSNKIVKGGIIAGAIAAGAGIVALISKAVQVHKNTAEKQ